MSELQSEFKASLDNFVKNLSAPHPPIFLKNVFKKGKSLKLKESSKVFEPQYQKIFLFCFCETGFPMSQADPT
jgi:hypothetical protein